MPLVKQSLASAILSAFSKAQASNSESARQALANDLATAIDSYIRSATVTVQPGQTVETAGSPAAQTGYTTSAGVGNIS